MSTTGSTHASLAEDGQIFAEKKLVFLWSFTIWLVVMNTTMFNVALPNVLHDLKLSAGVASWIVSGYSIVFAIATITYSRLSDFIPIRRLLTVGLILLGMASLIGLFAHQFYILLFARLLQAAGAGAVPGLAMVLAGRYIPAIRRGRAMSLIASASSLGFGLGPVIGGAIVQGLGWNYLFAVTGLTIVLLPIFKKLLPTETVKPAKFDFLGGILTGLGVTGLMLFLSTFSYWILLVSFLSLFLLWRHIRAREMPFIQPELLKNKAIRKLLFFGFSAFIVHFAALFLMPMMLTVLFQKQAAAIGVIIFPGAMLSAVAAQFIGRIIDRFGNIPVLFFGQMLLLIALISFALFGSLSPYAILITYMFMSTGFSALTSSVANEVSKVLPAEDIGGGMGLIQLGQFFGGAFGVALTGVSLVWQKQLPPEVSYQHIFLGLTGLIVVALLLLWTYIKKNQY